MIITFFRWVVMIASMPTVAYTNAILFEVISEQYGTGLGIVSFLFGCFVSMVIVCGQLEMIILAEKRKSRSGTFRTSADQW